MSVNSSNHNQILNIGVVGLGEQFIDNIMPAISSVGDICIKSVCDTNSNRLSFQSRRLNAIGYSRFEEMISKESLDGIIAVSYPSVHYEVIKLSAEKKLPVLVEKPPVESTQQLETILREYKHEASSVVVGLNFGFSESFQKLNSLIRQGKIGDPLLVNVTHYADKPKEPLWGLNTIRSMLLAQAIHPLGLLLEIGRIVSLIDAKLLKKDNGLFLNMIISMQNKNGESFTANIVTGSSAPYFNWNVNVFGSKGIADIDSLNELHVRSTLYDKWWEKTWNSSPVMSGGKRSGFEQEIRDFVKLIKGDETEHHNKLHDMLPVYRIIDQLEDIYVGE